MSRSGPIGTRGGAARRLPDDQAQPITQPSPQWPPQYGDPGQRAPQQQAYGQPPPARWPLADDQQPTQAAAQPHWPPPQQQGFAQPAGQGYYFPQAGAEGENPQGYPPQAAHQASVHPLPFNRFPPAPEADAGRGFAPAPQPSAHQLPFNRHAPPAPEADYGYAQQGAEQQPGFGFPQGGQPADPRGFDLGNYMSAPGQQGYAQAEAGHFQAQHEPPGFAAPQGYAETDGEYDESMPLEEEEPRRGRRGLMIVAALVGAIGLGGGMAYGYKTFFPTRTGPTPVITNTQGPTKSKSDGQDGKRFTDTDKKLLNRLGDETGPSTAGGPPPNAADAPDDRAASDDPNAPRKVRLIPITPGGGPQPMPGMVVSTPSAPMMGMPGVTLENMQPPGVRVQVPPQGAPPSAARVQLPQQAPPVRVVPQAPVRVASAASMPPPAAAEPVAPVKKVPVAKAAPSVPKTKEASAAPTVTASSGAGFVAVLSSQKSRMDALKIFANMQEKYGTVLASRTPDVQEANLGEKGGVRYRLIVGPPGSRDSAKELCTQLKAAGHADCWVTAY